MKSLVFLFSLLAGTILFAQESLTVLNSKRTILEAERSSTFQKMTEMREAKIKSDPTLRRMHDQILSLHRKLALLLDSNKEIHEINNKILKLDSEIEAIQNQINAKKTESKNKGE